MREAVGSTCRATRLARFDAVDPGRRIMALRSTTHLGRVSSAPLDLIWIVIAVAAIVAALLVLTWIFGVNASGPGYQLVPDPAGPYLPF
jgi:hypothetical protein